jgi:hypothetical protein
MQVAWCDDFTRFSFSIHLVVTLRGLNSIVVARKSTGNLKEDYAPISLGHFDSSLELRAAYNRQCC